MDFQSDRPPGFEGIGDRYLERIVENLTDFLIETQDELTYDTLELPEEDWEILAQILVEFAEDLHNDIGLWHSLEQYQRDFFGTPLPLCLRLSEKLPAEKLNKERVCYLLWVLYPVLKPDLIMAPTHQDLQWLAAEIADFLVEAFARVPRGSGVKMFLAQHQRFGWEVKRKLVWLGQHAYLFRLLFWDYLETRGGQPDINTIDDFICQETTVWSGLGVIDILAATLKLSNSQRADLRSWYERHMAFYRVVKVKRTQLQLKNLINGQMYRVRVDVPGDTFKPGMVVSGSLVPWDGAWYWSGQQSLYKEMSQAHLEEVRQTFYQKMSNVVYRYDKERLQQARESIEIHHRAFVEHFGDDLAIFADGRSLAAEMQAYYRRINEERLAEMPEDLKTKHGPPPDVPKPSYPPEILESKDVGIFFNPGEGTELMTGFNDVISSLEKQGQDLSEDERDALYGLITADAISPAFVQRLVKEYGAESIAAAFLIDDWADEPFLPYLLRRYKGDYFRNRYPTLSII